jgi:2-C-methyl-D-erythritol 4-phosphate cytidylyltransferase
MQPDPMDDDVAWGVVLTDDRGSLPFTLVHGEALAAAAVWALGEAGVQPVDLTVPWSSLREAGDAVVLHDSLCPLTPPEFIAACLAEAVEHDEAVVGVRPVTDTVKTVQDGVVGATVDRDHLVVVCSPVVLPGSVVAELDDEPGPDLVALVAELGRRGPVRRVEAPSAAHRVDGADDVRLLEALTQPLRQR